MRCAAAGAPPPAPLVPDHSTKPACRPAQPSRQVRVPTHIVSSICDDRGEEPTYCGVPMSELMETDANVGDAIG